MKKLQIAIIAAATVMAAALPAYATMTVTLPLGFNGSVVGYGTSYGEQYANVDMHFTTMAPVDVLVNLGGGGPGMYGLWMLGNQTVFMNNSGQSWTGFRVDLFKLDGSVPNGWSGNASDDMDIYGGAYGSQYLSGLAGLNSPYVSWDFVAKTPPGTGLANGGDLHLSLDIEVIDPDATGFILRYTPLGVVPEPTTMIAGALLLLPFGASTLRLLRKTRTA